MNNHEQGLPFITFTPEFKKEYKRLSKKYKSLQREMFELVEELKMKPTLGISLGKSAYKIRWL